MPEMPDMQHIECTECKVWYHSDYYVTLPPTIGKSVAWYCDRCQQWKEYVETGFHHTNTAVNDMPVTYIINVTKFKYLEI